MAAFRQARGCVERKLTGVAPPPPPPPSLPRSPHSCLTSVISVNKMFNERGHDGKIFLYAFPYVYWEQDRVLLSECLQNLGLALAGVILVCLVLMGDLKSCVVVAGSVVVVDVLLFGMMHVAGIRFNSIAVTNLIMAVGLSVDYTLHLVHRFQNMPGQTRVERVQMTLTGMGPAVVVGGFSTFLGVLPMTMATSVIFRTFMKMMFGTVVFGLGAGLLLVPAVLTLFGPPAIAEQSGKEIQLTPVPGP